MSEEIKYKETPKNPGVDDGKCALCETRILEEEWEDSFCHGCGYHICEDCGGDAPMGVHLVVEHQDEDFL